MWCSHAAIPLPGVATACTVTTTNEKIVFCAGRHRLKDLMVERIDIERALDRLASDEGGFRFQSLAVVLGKLRWPELMACEHHNDRGLDAHAPSVASPGGKGKGLASSITGSYDKVKSDGRKNPETLP